MKTKDALNGLKADAVTDVAELLANPESKVNALEFYARLKRAAALIDECMKATAPEASIEFTVVAANDPDARAWKVLDFATVTGYTPPATWIYPKAVIQLESQLKVAKEESKADGTARRVESKSAEQTAAFKVSLLRV